MGRRRQQRTSLFSRVLLISMAAFLCVVAITTFRSFHPAKSTTGEFSELHEYRGEPSAAPKAPPPPLLKTRIAGSPTLSVLAAPEDKLLRDALAREQISRTSRQSVQPAVTLVTYFDIDIDGVRKGRVFMGLYGDTVPKTAENFRSLCVEDLKGLAFKGSHFHRIIPGFIVQGGDFTRGDGRGGKSIYGPRFADEAAGLRLKHSGRYVLQMANSGPDSNGSQFCFMLGAAPHLNGKHVVFGKVLAGFHVVDAMEKAGTASGRPTQRVVVAGSGQVILADQDGDGDGGSGSDAEAK